MNTLLESTPRADGFRMPGEHERQQAVVMAWPERPDTWRDNAGPAREAFAGVAAAILPATPVITCVRTDQVEQARAILPPGVQVMDIPSNDAWMRDIGPSYVVDDRGRDVLDRRLPPPIVIAMRRFGGPEIRRPRPAQCKCLR